MGAPLSRTYTSIHDPHRTPALSAGSSGGGFGLLLAALLLVLLLVPLGHPDRVLRALLDGAHVLLGGALAVALASWLEGALGSRAASGFVAVVLAAGLLLLFEFVQPFVGREFGWDDALAGICGALGAVLLLRGPSGGWALATVPLGLGLLLFGMRDGALDVYDAWRQRSAFPLLASFEDDLELRRVEPQGATVARVEAFASDGRSSLRVDLLPGSAPTVSLATPPQDWRPYAALAFDVEVDGGGSLPLLLQIVDAAAQDRPGDRYRETFLLHAGENHVEVPLGHIASALSERRVDLGAIDAVEWSVEGLDTLRTVHLDAIRLVPAAE